MEPRETHPQLALRLRALRVEQWPDLKITQRNLAKAFSAGGESASGTLISNWESPDKAVVPPVHRLAAYATFFATRRSVDGANLRLLNDGELTAAERAERDRLYGELARLRGPDDEPAADPSSQHPRSAGIGGHWHFPDGAPVIIAVAALPDDKLEQIPNAAANSLDFVEAYRYADLDSILELFGHIRAANPLIEVRIHLADMLQPDDYTGHLVLIGGTDWNPVFSSSARRLNLPVRQLGRESDADVGGFDVGGARHLPIIDNGRLEEDTALFYRGRNPYNRRCTVTLCSGAFVGGTYGAVRALTDKRFRDTNEDFIAERFGTRVPFGLIFRVAMENGLALTPDWNEPENRLFEWPEPTQ